MTIKLRNSMQVLIKCLPLELNKLVNMHESIQEIGTQRIGEYLSTVWFNCGWVKENNNNQLKS